jgi:hypothetical protein
MKKTLSVIILLACLSGVANAETVTKSGNERQNT